MSVNEMHLSSQRHVAPFRLLGTIAMIGAPMLLAEFVYRQITHLQDNQSDHTVGLFSVLYIGGWICSAIGLHESRATGTGAIGKAIFFVQLTGLFLAGLWAAAELTHQFMEPGTLLFTITDMAWPLSHLFMLIVGVCVLKAGIWQGWRKFAPLFCGLVLPGFFAASAAGARNFGLYLFSFLTAVTFTALGYAVRTSDRA